VDLPGYGFAAVDKATKARWQAELARFLETRLSLVALIVVMDIRHPFGPLDDQLLRWFGKRQQPVHILLTKCDKLNRNDQAQALQAAVRKIQEHGEAWGGSVSCSLFSALSRTGREEVLDRIRQWWQIEEPLKEAPTQERSKKNPARESPGGKA
jgi:GTP-binding protein